MTDKLKMRCPRCGKGALLNNMQATAKQKCPGCGEKVMFLEADEYQRWARAERKREDEAERAKKESRSRQAAESRQAVANRSSVSNEKRWDAYLGMSLCFAVGTLTLLFVLHTDPQYQALERNMGIAATVFFFGLGGLMACVTFLHRAFAWILIVPLCMILLFIPIFGWIDLALAFIIYADALNLFSKIPKDLRDESRPPEAWLLSCLLLPAISQLIYLLKRDEYKAWKQEPAVAGDRVPCPYCAEMIRPNAIRCRYCQSNIT